jgi:hypothetical protein
MYPYEYRYTRFLLSVEKMHHLRFMQNLFAKMEIHLAPKPRDVVCSVKYKWCKQHPGNVYYVKLLQKYAPQLQATTGPTREDYEAMIDTISKKVLDRRGGRFLKPADDASDEVWIELNRDEAKDRIQTSLYNQRSQLRRRQVSSDNVILNNHKRRKKVNMQKSYRISEIATAQVMNAVDDDDDDSTNRGDLVTDDNSEDESLLTANKGAAPLPQPDGLTKNKPDLHRHERSVAGVNKMILFTPQRNDVICSRKWNSKHPGNFLYMKLVNKNLPKIEKAVSPTKQQYGDMADKILEIIINQRKGRFLRPTDDRETFCVCLTRCEAKRKVLRALYMVKYGADCRRGLSPTNLQQGTATLSTNRKRRKDNAPKIKTVKRKRAQISDNGDEPVSRRRLFNYGREDDETSSTLFKTATLRLPPSYDQSRDKNHHRRHHENHLGAAEMIIPLSPERYDVVGSIRREWAQKHPGNLLYRSLLEKYSSQLREIQNPTRQHYMAMVNKILEAVVDQRQGRFLKPTDRSETFCTIMSRRDVEHKIHLALYKVHKRMNPLKQKLVLSRRTKAEIGGKSADNDAMSTSTTTTLPRQPPLGHPCTADKKSNDYQTSGSTHNTYGGVQEEITMRSWLNDNRLPQLVGDILLTLGARDIEDVTLLVEEQPDVLHKELVLLDFLKLKRTVSSRLSV